MAIIETHSGKNYIITHSIDKEPKDEQFEPHIHDYHELFCLVKGNVGYMVEGTVYSLVPGAILLMRSSETHKLIVNKSNEYERYVLNFSSELFSKNGFSESILSPYFERELGQGNLYLPSELNIGSPIPILEKLMQEMSILNTQDAILSNLSYLMTSLKIAFLNKNHSFDKGDKGMIISYINNNLTKDITISDISKAVHLSPSQISRIFKGLTGTSVHDYILSKRLILFQEKVKGGISVTKACIECGFKDYSSFYRLYKKRFGVSPSKK